MPKPPDHTKNRKPLFNKLKAKRVLCEGFDEDGNERELFHGLREAEAMLSKLRQHVEDNGQ